MYVNNQWCNPGHITIHVSCCAQAWGLQDTMHRSAFSSSWFARSDWPLDWGWKPEVRLAVAPRRWQNSFQNVEVNWGPLSETTSLGNPCRRNT